MSISNKVKALLTIKKIDRVSVANCLDISLQALNNKFYRNSFSSEDLIKIANCAGVTLAFVLDGTEIAFDINDLEK